MKLKFITTILLITCITQFSFSQISRVGNLEIYFNNYILNMPSSGGNEFVEPTPQNISTWKSAIESFFNQDYTTTVDSLNVLDYDLIFFTDTITNTQHYIFEKMSNGLNHWGAYVLNSEPCISNVIIQSPHPKSDTNTGNQGIHVYLDAQVFAFMISGTHRCNSTTLSSCDGKSSSCSGVLESYPVSDMAHNIYTIFYATTQELNRYVSDPYFLQLHGFNKLQTDPYLIFSNSSDLAPPGEDLLLLLAEELVIIDPVLSFEIPHVNTNWTRLRGFNNVQGRYVNGSTNPCAIISPANEGRFFHLEQERIRLRETVVEWAKMAEAVKKTFNSVEVNDDTIYQSVISASDTLDIFPFDHIVPTSIIFQSGTEINIHPSTYFPTKDIEIKIK